MLDTEVVAELLATPSIKALVKTRIHPAPLPQNVTMPAISYQRISTIEDICYDGVDGLTQIRLQLNFFAKTFTDARTLQQLVRGVLKGKRFDERRISLIHMENGGDLYSDEVKAHDPYTDYLVIGED